MDLTKSHDMTVMIMGGGRGEGNIRTKFQLFVVAIPQVMIKVKTQEITMIDRNTGLESWRGLMQGTAVFYSKQSCVYVFN